MCNLQSLVLVLTTFAVACNGFFWNTQREAEQQKSMPLSYFRTYTYHPLTLQTPQQLQQTYRLVPTTNNLFTPQLLSKSTPAGTFTPQTILAPANMLPGPQPQQPQNIPGLPQQPIQHQPPPQSPPVQAQPQFNQYADMSGFHSMMQPSQPLPPQPMQPQPQQNMRQAPYYPENPFQYIPPPPQYNLQQVQFVPCMCPVTLSLPNEPLPEKRIDEGISTSISNSGLNNVSVEPQQMIESNPDNKL